MKLLHVVHYPVFGGPHNRAIRLANPLSDRGWETVVLLPNEPGNAAGRLEEAGVEVVQIPLHRLRENRNPRVHLTLALRLPFEIARIRQLLRERQIDLVLVNGLVNPHSAIAARLEGIPVVWQILDTRTPMGLRKVLMPLVTRLADVVMSTGITVAEAHPGAVELGSRLVSFFPAVDVDEFRPDSQRREAARESLGVYSHQHVIGNLSNINPQKGHATFIRAAAALKRTHPNVRFVILGATYDHHSAYAESLWKGAEELGLQLGEDLIVRDPGSEAAESLPAFDVFWMTPGARSEGIPTVVEEAMACGLPVVATDIGSVREAVEDGTTGFIVPPQNPEAIAAATLQLLQDADLCKRFGASGRRRAVELFDVEACADTHVRAFELAIRVTSRP